MSTVMVEAAQAMLALGWPVMAIKPMAKEPLLAHGVHDATLDTKQVRRWWRQWPEANLAVATGHPGPQVLDIDDLTAAGQLLLELRRLNAPTAATHRGPHLYFRGTTAGTVSLPYGELRGRGSYVLVPPSIHPTGQEYVWLDSPHGPLPDVPAMLEARRSAGQGTFAAPELIAHGARHDALKDAAVRFLRGGFTDPATLEQMLAAFFHARCVPDPPARPGEFRKLALWAASTELAERERRFTHSEQTETPAPAKKAKKADRRPTGLEHPPAGDAPLADHRAYLRTAGGWPDAVDVQEVRRYGRRPADSLELELTNGQVIRFDRQDHVTTRGHWTRTVAACTDGIADPQPLTEWEMTKVFRSLCILARAPLDERTEADDVADAIADLLAIADPLPGHDLNTAAGRYDLIARCRARAPFDPRRPDQAPVVIIDTDGRWHLRAGEVRDYFNAHGVGNGPAPGRMRLIGAEPLSLDGREAPRPDRARRRTNRMLVYRLPT